MCGSVAGRVFGRRMRQANDAHNNVHMVLWQEHDFDVSPKFQDCLERRRFETAARSCEEADFKDSEQFKGKMSTGLRQGHELLPETPMHRAVAAPLINSGITIIWSQQNERRSARDCARTQRHSGSRRIAGTAV